jgi:dGTP triphosphohydrolase
LSGSQLDADLFWRCLAPAQNWNDESGKRWLAMPNSAPIPAVESIPEAPPEWRTEYQRDRDRVIHSRAFRRLEYKTQVFLNGTGDHLRTRLTHTIEVAAITRNIARALRTERRSR